MMINIIQEVTVVVGMETISLPFISLPQNPRRALDRLRALLTAVKDKILALMQAQPDHLLYHVSGSFTKSVCFFFLFFFLQ